MRRARFLVSALAAVLLSATALASESAPAADRTVRYASSSAGEASGYLALPVGSGRHPAVIVIHEWYGLNDWAKQQAERIAAKGYVALAVDLYRGKVGKDASEAHELMRGMPEDRAIADLRAAFEYLSKRDDVDPSRIGVIGWCMGGGYALALATVEPRLAATVINYGRLVTDPATIAKIESPVLGNFGGADRGISVEDITAFETAMKKAGKQVDIRIYDGAAHAFMNPNNDRGFDRGATEESWTRIDRFLAANLRAKIPNY